MRPLWPMEIPKVHFSISLKKSTSTNYDKNIYINGFLKLLIVMMYSSKFFAYILRLL